MKYYSISEDIEKYPDAWAYIIIGGRNCGKTYGALKDRLLAKSKHVFVKRTIDDVDLLCAGNHLGKNLSDYSVDLSPYKSINRDLCTNVRSFKINKGLGGFWNCGTDGEAVGDPVGYLCALSAVQKFKGFDLSDSDWMIFDEFIPQPWEKVSRKEGEQVMDLYKTISRDRVQRGKPELKLIALANATEPSNPLCNILEITDDIVKMELNNQEYLYIEERGILIHRVENSSEFMDSERGSKFFAAMAETDWGHMAWDNQFAYADFSNVERINLKNYKPVCHIIYKRKDWYLYENNGFYYMTKSSAKCPETINLNTDNGQRLYAYNYVMQLKLATMEGKVKYEDFMMYDVTVNFKEYFKI